MDKIKVTVFERIQKVLIFLRIFPHIFHIFFGLIRLIRTEPDHHIGRYKYSLENNFLRKTNDINSYNNKNQKTAIAIKIEMHTTFITHLVI